MSFDLRVRPSLLVLYILRIVIWPKSYKSSALILTLDEHIYLFFKLEEKKSLLKVVIVDIVYIIYSSPSYYFKIKKRFNSEIK